MWGKERTNWTYVLAVVLFDFNSPPGPLPVITAGGRGDVAK